MPNPELDYRLASRERQAVNVLPLEKQIQIVNALVEGNSIRSTARMVGVEHKTVMRVLLRVGQKCQRLLDERMRGLQCSNVQVDEIWTFVGKKEKRVNGIDDPFQVGDQYVFVAMDAESKLIPSFRIGKRSAENAWYFMRDLSERVSTRMQITSDGFRPYYAAVEDAFGANVDYAMLVKIYGEPAEPEKRYSPAEIVDARPIPVSGNPKLHLISTSHIERQNLTIRMQLRRFTRLTNAFSKKLDNLKAAISLHFAWYNFVRIHSSLRVTPAMAAGISDHVWDFAEFFK
ncbi:MAG TPA: IS1 family transposase [Candidatus Acidoferrales bacterium]|nr:IS1 family transposase [Candidatus Acidoferrales bacterium]